MNDINPELIEKARRLTDWDRHQYRVDTVTWNPRCKCGWTATSPYGMEEYDRHITETVLTSVADDLRAEGAAQALRDAIDELDRLDDGRDTGYTHAGRHIIARLRARADRIEATQNEDEARDE